MNIEKYVEDYLKKRCNEFIRGIVLHGIYNMTNDVYNGKDENEYNLIAEEFLQQSKYILETVENEKFY